MTAKRLREIRGNATTVLSVFITEPVTSTNLGFVEDFFTCINDQLNEKASIASRECRSASASGQPIKDRILSLERDIASHLTTVCQSNTHAFLIMDGYDRINEAIRTVIGSSLTKLHNHGLRSMITRRVSAYAAPIVAICDGCDTGDLNHYWECVECEKRGEESWLCYSCYYLEPEPRCPKCPATHFTENQPHVNLMLRIQGENRARYVSEMLKREFGALEETECETIRKYIDDHARDNIALARLYLDNILELDTLADFDPHSRVDRLPSNIIFFFEAKLRELDVLPNEQRRLAMLSIAAAAAVHDVTGNGAPLRDFGERIRPYIAPLRGVEDVLSAAQGWIYEKKTSERQITPFSISFSLYAAQDYNESLIVAREMLGIPRSGRRLVGTSSIPSVDPELCDLQTRPKILDTLGTLASDSSISTLATTSVSNTDEGGISTRRTSLQSSECGSIQGYQQTDEDQFWIPPRMTDDQLLGSSSAPDAESRWIHPRICNFCCTGVLGAQSESGEHRGSSNGLKAAEYSCVFCAALYAKISENEKKDIAWPIYKWTVRILIQGKDSERLFVLTFRPTQQSSQHLAPKRFLFFSEDSINTSTIGQLGPSTNPLITQATLRQIESWIQTCCRQHEACYNSAKSSFVPTRLLDLQSPDPKFYKIINTKCTAVTGQYCTLSHSWGAVDFIQTTSSNLEKHLTLGVPKSDLPKNFLEAIDVVQCLGIRYVWIDSLCIVQGPGGDFGVQGGLMHLVYRNSYCNIVAADSRDPEGGLFRNRSPDLIVPVSYTVCQPSPIFGQMGQKWKITRTDFWDSHLLKESFIYSRGWVFQERMLSPRLLHFARDQIFWECASVSACETLPSGLPMPLDTTSAMDRHWRGRLALAPTKDATGAVDNESPYSFWDSAVRSYTACNLTNNADKCAAIWSVAKALRDIVNEEYAAGMWGKQFVEQLAWRVRDMQQSRRPADLQVENPSWSWTSIHGRIEPQNRITPWKSQVTDHNGAELRFKVKDEGGRDQMPVLTSKSLTVSGYVHSGKIEQTNGSGSAYRICVGIEDGEDSIFDVFPDEDPESMPELYADCVCVVLATNNTQNNNQDEDEDDDAYFAYAFENYDGMGLVMVKSVSWLELQRSRLPNLQKDHDRLKRQKSHSFCEKRPCEKRKEVEGILKLIELEKKNQKQEGLHYRRVGTVVFRDLGEKTWEWKRPDTAVKFWLD